MDHKMAHSPSVCLLQQIYRYNLIGFGFLKISMKRGETLIKGPFN